MNEEDFLVFTGIILMLLGFLLAVASNFLHQP